MKKTGKKGFSYFVDIDDIRRYMKVPYKWRLDWLEEANEFTRHALSGQKLQVWEKLRKGEI